MPAAMGWARPAGGLFHGGSPVPAALLRQRVVVKRSDHGHVAKFTKPRVAHADPMALWRTAMAVSRAAANEAA